MKFQYKLLFILILIVSFLFFGKISQIKASYCCYSDQGFIDCSIVDTVQKCTDELGGKITGSNCESCEMKYNQCTCLSPTGSIGRTLLNIAGTKAGYKAVSDDGLNLVIGNIINGLLGFIGAVFFILVIYGGFLWMTAGGNDEKAGKAKKIITNSTVGLAIVILSGIISYFVSYLIETGSAPNPQ